MRRVPASGNTFECSVMRVTRVTRINVGRHPSDDVLRPASSRSLVRTFLRTSRIERNRQTAHSETFHLAMETSRERTREIKLSTNPREASCARARAPIFQRSNEAQNTKITYRNDPVDLILSDIEKISRRFCSEQQIELEYEGTAGRSVWRYGTTQQSRIAGKNQI